MTPPDARLTPDVTPVPRTRQMRHLVRLIAQLRAVRDDPTVTEYLAPFAVLSIAAIDALIVDLERIVTELERLTEIDRAESGRISGAFGQDARTPDV